VFVVVLAGPVADLHAAATLVPLSAVAARGEGGFEVVRSHRAGTCRGATLSR